MIGIINYGMGNLSSVKNALDYLSIPNILVNNPDEINSCSKLILPGVGAFGLAMHNLHELKFIDSILEFTQVKQKALLGLCLGMQLLFEKSCEHGTHNGLSLIKGEVKNLNDSVKNLPVPHMGWNQLIETNKSTLLKDVVKEDQIMYFVHSYYCSADNKEQVTAQVNYEFNFDVMIESNNIFGCQFHPEKSQKSGLQILKNFAQV